MDEISQQPPTISMPPVPEPQKTGEPKHKSWAIFLAVLLVAIMIGALGFAYWEKNTVVNLKETGFDTYVNNNSGFSIRYPTSWQIQNTTQDGSVRFTNDSGTSAQIVVSPYTKNDEDAIYAGAAQAGYATSTLGLDNGDRATLIQSSQKLEKVYTEAVLIKNQTIYEFMFFTPRSAYKNNINLFLDSAKSLNVFATTTSTIRTNLDDPSGGKELITINSGHVYLEGNVLKVDTAGPLYEQEPDAATFQAVGSAGSYFKDRNSVYFLNWQAFAEVTGADPNTFMPVFNDKGKESPLFGKDSKSIFLSSKTIVGADPSSFVPFADSAYYAKDAKHVFVLNQGYFSRIIVGADSITFTLVTGQQTYDAQDKNHKYYQGEIVQ